MKLRILLLLSVLLSVVPLSRAVPTSEFPLWPEGAAPGSLGAEPKDTPTLTPFWPAPEKATGATIIVFPGGGYQQLAAHEGEPFARWLNDLGITAFVLKYRLYPSGYHLQEIIQDAARAVRTVRTNAAEWKLDPKRIGVVGSSAGGHLAAVLSTQFDAGKAESPDPIERVSSRPDATILCYGFILFDEKTMANPKSRETALGKDVPDDVAIRFAPARNVRKDTPPCFIWQTVEDSGSRSKRLCFRCGLARRGRPVFPADFRKRQARHRPRRERVQVGCGASSVDARLRVLAHRTRLRQEVGIGTLSTRSPSFFVAPISEQVRSGTVQRP